MSVTKIIEFIEGTRKAKGMTRKQMAYKMSNGYTKEKLDKVMDGAHLPSAHTIALMLEALELASYPSEWFEQKEEESHE